MNPLLDIDATKLSLGIETTGGIFNKLIQRNTRLPARKSVTISTTEDNQQLVTIMVYEGERGMVWDNKLIAQLDIGGIPAAPRGVPQIEVIFDCDVNGILHVSAQELKSRREKTLSVPVGANYSKEEIDNLVEYAQINSEIDKQKCALVEAQNYAESLCFSCSKALEEYNSRINNDLKAEIVSSLNDCKACLGSDNVEVITSKVEGLSKALQAMYEQMQCGDGGGDEVTE